MRLLLVLSALAVAGCPTPEPGTCAAYEAELVAGENSCVNEENLAQCYAIEDDCPNGIAALESCPLGFACR